jgi:hypothetical protein
MLAHDILIQPFMPDDSVVAFDIGILLRLSRLDILDADAAPLGPGEQLATDIFRTVSTRILPGWPRHSMT